MTSIQKFTQFAPKKNELDNSSKAIIYTRVSTKEQAETNTSLGTQKQYCQDYATRNGLEVIKYFGGTYESAKTDERKEFKKMLKYVRQSGSIGYILVYAYDRFSRSGTGAAQISQELLSQGIKLVSVTQEIDIMTPSGQLNQNILLSFSKFDNDLRREKTVTAMKDLVRKGFWLWIPPLGYGNKNKYQKAANAEYYITKEGQLLKKAFKWKLKGLYSNVEIVEKLSRLGLVIDERRLQEAFKNPFYCGIIISKLIPGEAIVGKHPPLVSKKDFLQINHSGTLYPKKRKDDNDNLPLKRFMYCQTCKEPMTGYIVKRKGLYYYKCRKKGCKNNKSAKIIHDKFKSVLSLYGIHPKYQDILKEVMTYTFESITNEGKTKRTVQKRELIKVEKKIATIEERFAIGEIEKPMYQKYKKKYE